MFKSFKKFILLSVFLLVVIFAFFGCKKDIPDESLTPEGVFEADLMSEDTFLFAQFSDANNDQKTFLNELLAKFPKAESAMSFSTFLNSNLSQYDLNYENDLLPVIAENKRISFGVNFDEERQDNDVLITVMIQDNDKALAFLDTVSTRAGFFQESMDDSILVGNADLNLYMSVYKDLILISNARDVLRKSFDRINDKTAALSDVELFKEQFANSYDQGFLFAYLNPSAPLGNISVAYLNDLADTNVQEFFKISAEEDGFYISAYIKADPKVKADLAEYKISSESAYLGKEVPENGLIFYTESANFLNALRMESQAQTDGFAKLSSTVNQYLGMDFEKDILTFLDKSIAFSLHSQGETFIPALNLVIDVSSNTKGAEEFVNKINTQIDGVIALMNMQFAQYAGILIKDTIDKDGNSLQHLKIDFSKVPDEVYSAFSQIPTSLKNNVLNLSYGVLKDNLLFISTANSFDLTEETLSQNSTFKNLQNKIDDYDDGLMFLEFKNLIPLVDKLIELNNQITGEVTVENDNLTYDLFKRYTETFEGIIFGTKINSPYEMEVAGFIQIRNEK